jgi:hypothetical protein
MMLKVRDELKKEKGEREEFEENIFNVLEDTCLRLAKRECDD